MHFLRRRLDRRTMLRGAGAAIGLPFLSAMIPPGCDDDVATTAPPMDAGARDVVSLLDGAVVPRDAMAKDVGAALGMPGATRLVFITVPNGFVGPLWTPPNEGTNYTLTQHLRVLEAHRNDFSVLSGLSNLLQESGGAFHTRGTATMLTCTAVDRNRVTGGVSIDQIAAARYGDLTTLPSLELGTSAPHSVALTCDGPWGCLWGDNISWAGPQRPQPKDADPASVFDRLFGAAVGGDAGAAWVARQQRRQSILDYALDDARRLNGTLGSADQARIDEYLTYIRDVERLIERERPPPPMGAQPPVDTGDLATRFQIMLELAALALMTDTTRIVTVMHGFAFFNYTYPHLGISNLSRGHHAVSHYNTTPGDLEAHAAVGDWELGQFGRFVARLKGIEDGGATLLDRSLVFFATELLDGNYHLSQNLPVLLAGRANGRIRTGFHRHYDNDTPIANLHQTVLSLAGVPTSRVGTTGTGMLTDLLA